MNLKEHMEWYQAHKPSKKQEEDMDRMRKLWEIFSKDNNLINDFMSYEDDIIDVKPEYQSYHRFGTDFDDLVVSLDDTNDDASIMKFFSDLVKEIKTNLVDISFSHRRNRETDSIDVILGFEYLLKKSDVNLDDYRSK